MLMSGSSKIIQPDAGKTNAVAQRESSDPAFNICLGHLDTKGSPLNASIHTAH